MPYWRLWIVIGLFLPQICWASVDRFVGTYSLGLAVENHGYDLIFEPSNTNSEVSVHYAPNTQSLSGYEIGYDWITLGLLTSDKLNEQELEKKGKTSYEQIRLNFSLGRRGQWDLKTYYNRYKGLYIANSQEVDASLSSTDPYIQRDDVEIFTAGGTMTYIWDSNDFSLAAAMSQSARQTGSGGSVLLTGSVDASTFKGERPLIPEEVRTEFGEDKNLEKVQFLTMSAMVGYGHTFVLWRNLFVTGAFSFGKGLQWRQYTVTNDAGDKEAIESVTNTGRTNLRFAFGYNAEHFYATASWDNDQLSYSTRSLDISSDLQTFRVAFGGRFY